MSGFGGSRALNLNLVRDAETRSAAADVRGNWMHTTQEQAPSMPIHASSQAASHRSLPLKRDSLHGIKVTSMVSTKTVKPPPASPRVAHAQAGQAQYLKTMMIKSSLADYGVTPKAAPFLCTLSHSLLQWTTLKL